MQRWHAKAICGAIMFVMMPICFLLPVRMVSLFSRWGQRGQDFLDLLSCFAGGVFLASYLVFMAPAVRVLIETNLMQPYGIEFPLPDAIIGLGFFMMLAINYIVRAVNDCTSARKKHQQQPHTAASYTRSRHESTRAEVYFDDVPVSATIDIITTDYASSSAPEPQNNTQLLPVDPYDKTATALDGPAANGRHGPSAPSVALSRQTSISSYYADAPPPQYRLPTLTRSVGGSKRNSIVEMVNAGAEAQSLVRSIVMMLALSVDSVLEGMTIGLKQTVVEVWAIFIGIVVHESVIAFCLGLQLVRLNAGRVGPVVAAAVVYTLMNPIGVIVATAVYETSDADPAVDLANGILQALTSGCFIYVVFYEILEGQITERTPLSRIVAIFVGYVFLASFAAIPGSGPYHYGGGAGGLGDRAVGDNVTIGSGTNGTTAWPV